MASFFRCCIANKVAPFIGNAKLASVIIPSFVKVNRNSRGNPELHLLWSKVANNFPEIENVVTPSKLLTFLKNQGLPTAEGIIDIGLNESPLKLTFTIDKHVYSKFVLTDICGEEENIKKTSCLFVKEPTKKVFVFSSLPTLGETMTINDFRNILQSNFIANMHSFVGNKVKKVYNIPDWDHRTALLLSGYKKFGTEEKLLKHSVNHLFEIKKVANFQYENDLNFKNEVDSSFEKIDSDNMKVSSWEFLKRNYIQSLESLFNKIGVNFENIMFNSSIRRQIKEAFEKLLNKNLLLFEKPGYVTINCRELKEVEFKISDPLVNQICSFFHVLTQVNEIDNVDDMYYVSSSEDRFFQILLTLMEKLEYQCLDHLHHISVQDIPNNNSSKTSLEDYLHKAKLHMLDQMKNQLYLENNDDLEEVAQALSYSCVQMHAMKYRRNKSDFFDVKNVVNFGKESGSAFQLCYAGLKGVQEDTEFLFKTDIDTSPLVEMDAQRLLIHLSRFDEIVHKSYRTLEPCFIHQYLSSLWYFTDRASNSLSLNIKNERLTVIKARLLLFLATQKIFERCLTLLGLKPYVNKYSQPTFIKNSL